MITILMFRWILLILMFFAATLLVVKVFGQKYSEFGNPLHRLTIKDVTVTIEVVNTSRKLNQGLSHRTGLLEGKGMLFLMPRAKRWGFCMRDMLFPIDIIWINDGKVVGIQPKLSPSDQGVFIPPVPVSMVLEVPGGFAERHGFKVGDPLKMHIPGLTLIMLQARAKIDYTARSYWAKLKGFLLKL